MFGILTAILAIFQYQFMQHAFEAGTIIAVIAGIMGYLVVLRRSTFAAHAFAEIGFAGAAGAVLIGVSPILGLLSFSTISGIGIALLGKRASERDLEIGIMLAFAMGLGLLFISLYTGYATEAYSILFGEILGISWGDVLLTLVVSLVILAAAAIVYRPLLFASLDEDVAEAKGMPTTLLGVIFMVLLAATVSIAVQVVGVLLIFTLTVTPAAIAIRLTTKPLNAIVVSVIVALIVTWLGLLIAYFEPYPVSFFITGLAFALYLLVRFAYPALSNPQTPAAKVNSQY
jgi:zinc/manganese transport system permease protein